MNCCHRNPLYAKVMAAMTEARDMWGEIFGGGFEEDLWSLAGTQILDQLQSLMDGMSAPFNKYDFEYYELAFGDGDYTQESLALGYFIAYCLDVDAGNIDGIPSVYDPADPATWPDGTSPYISRYLELIDEAFSDAASSNLTTSAEVANHIIAYLKSKIPPEFICEGCEGGEQGPAGPQGEQKENISLQSLNRPS